MSETLSHIYKGKTYARFRNGIFTVCSGFMSAKEKSVGRCSATAWFIDGVRQWSFGAGSNATCPHCLAEWLKRTSATTHIAVTKLHDTIVAQENTIKDLSRDKP